MMALRPRPLHGLLIVPLLIALTIQPAAAGGIEFSQLPDYRVPADTDVDNEVWVGADTIAIDGTLRQSLFGLTQTADLDGAFEKDVWIIGREIELHGVTRQNARFAARDSIQIYGQVGQSLMAAAVQSIRIDEAAVIGQDALLTATDVLVLGEINGDLTVRAKRAILSGRIAGDADIQADEITLLKGAQIRGNFTYDSAREPAYATNQIAGAVEKHQPVARTELSLSGIVAQVFFFLAALVAGLCFIAILPRYTEAAVRRVRTSFWQSLLTGAIAFFLLPLAALLLLFTLIGIPLALLTGISYGLLLYAAKFIVGIAIAGALLKRGMRQPFTSQALCLAVGLILLYGLGAVPLIGGMVSIVVLFTGLGGLILGIKTQQQDRPSKPTDEPRFPERALPL
jgi:cytoskeletal protein CcmA (bactofilin family)